MTPDNCRERARECVELAQTANTARHRTMLLDMAAKWLQLAGLSQQDIEIIAADAVPAKKVEPRAASPGELTEHRNGEVNSCGHAIPKSEQRP